MLVAVGPVADELVAKIADRTRTLRTGDDAWGFGLFPGQYGMAVYSTAPIDHRAVRTFQLQLWSQMPDSLLPWDYYGREIGKRLRLSSKSHWDVPVRTPAGVIHLLAAHPTPPVFDGPENRNGLRNHDEIRFWADYVSSPRQSSYIYDDEGVRGGLKPGERFVLVGDYNADPHDGGSLDGAINQLLDPPRVSTSVTPSSEGGAEQAGETVAFDEGGHGQRK